MRSTSKLSARPPLLALLAALAACSAPSPPPTLEVELHGCAHVLGPAESPSCVLEEGGELRLWVHAAAEVEVTVGGWRWTSGETERVEGGFLVSLVAVDAPWVEVIARRGEHRSEPWRLPLLPPVDPESVVEARKLIDCGLPDDARKMLDEALSQVTRPMDRALVLALLARLDRHDGQLESAADRLGAAAILAHQEGFLSTEIDLLTQLFHLHFYDRDDLEAARAALDRLPAAPAGDTWSHYLSAFYLGVRSSYLGDTRTALRSFEQAATHAGRFALEQGLAAVAQMQAQEWNRLGRFEEAVSLLKRFEPTLSTGCDRGTLLNNLAWSHLLSWEAGSAAPTPEITAQVRAWLEQAIELDTECSDAEVKSAQANAYLNLALADFHAGEPGQAQRHVAAARKLEPDPEWWQRIWQHDLEARIARAEGRAPAALELYRALETLGEQALAPEARWRAQLGSARALEELGRRDAALEALEKSEALADELLLRASIDAGREDAAVVWEAGTRLHLELLLAAGEPERAFELARRARSRVLRALLHATRLSELPAAERDRWTELTERYRELRHVLEDAAASSWQLPLDQRRDLESRRQQLEQEQRELLDEAFSLLGDQDLIAGELPELRPGELLLAYHPLPEGWVGFAASKEGGVEARRLESPEKVLDDPAALAPRLLEPFAARIAAASQIRILPYGPLRAVDFHALPFGDGILLEVAPVVYGLDLPTGASPPQDRARRRARVIADPTQTLLDAAEEARDVEQALRAMGWQVDRPERGNATELLQQLGEIELFHFAGHADFSGRGGWDSGLKLADASQLKIGDLLTAPRLPRLVVLSACESGLTSPAARVEGLGLATAFLLGGSAQAIGALETVDDRTTRALMKAFYRALGEGSDGAEALRRAQLAVRRRDPAGWASFRLVER